MTDWYKIDRQGGDRLTDIRQFLKSVLGLESVSAMLVPRQLPTKDAVMPSLVSRPVLLDDADPLAPAFAVNSAKNISQLTRKGLDANIAAVLRPCEIRAHIELVKLHQSASEPVLIIGMDCLGAFSNRCYQAFLEENEGPASEAFCRARLSGAEPSNTVEISPACRMCEQPIPEGADIILGLYGISLDEGLFLQARTERGKEVLDNIGARGAKAPEQREQVVQSLIKERTEKRDQVFEETAAAVNTIEKLSEYLSGCVNCYNCRVACPACYCRECVFTTDVFDHDPLQYLKWSERKGALKMPTDTIFYHITRLVHMGTACVGCGQCANACPNDIPLTQLFRMVAHRTQAAFDYQAGRSADEPPPLTIFKEEEFDEIVGLGS
ncbi:MAG: Coenzyme F420 hydrogenase/dehydrogenase, beta subunit C-terminal domain [Desulfobacterales bacterium]|nr:Coenzyme F420 hydrogenase/dehydrogenase, beta subunit C-terminal domain [Desulfobacterales bacterium]